MICVNMAEISTVLARTRKPSVAQKTAQINHRRDMHMRRTATFIFALFPVLLYHASSFSQEQAVEDIHEGLNAYMQQRYADAIGRVAVWAQDEQLDATLRARALVIYGACHVDLGADAVADQAFRVAIYLFPRVQCEETFFSNAARELFLTIRSELLYELRIETEPSGAAVEMDGLKVGNSPCMLTLLKNRPCRIGLSKLPFYPLHFISLPGSPVDTLRIVLERGWGNLNIVTSPENVSFYVFEDTNFRPAEGQFRAFLRSHGIDETRRVLEGLAPAGAENALPTPVRTGKTPATISLPFSAYHLCLMENGLSTHIKPFLLDTSWKEIRVEMRKAEGTLVLRHFPPIAWVAIDMDSLRSSRSPTTFSLGSGIHRLTVAAAGFRTFRGLVEIGAQDSSFAFVVLERNRLLPPFLYSVLFPGGGHLYRGNPSGALILATSTALLAGAYLAETLKWEHQRLQSPVIARMRENVLIGNYPQGAKFEIDTQAAAWEKDYQLTLRQRRELLTGVLIVHGLNALTTLVLPDRSYKEAVSGLGTGASRTRAAAYSMLFPGAGQYYKGQKTRGMFFAFTEGLGLGVYALEHWESQRARRLLASTQAAYYNLGAKEKHLLEPLLNYRKREYHKAQEKRDLSGILVIFLHLLNLFDAAGTANVGPHSQGVMSSTMGFDIGFANEEGWLVRFNVKIG